jgi:hypothetical protein
VLTPSVQKPGLSSPVRLLKVPVAREAVAPVLLAYTVTTLGPGRHIIGHLRPQQRQPRLFETGPMPRATGARGLTREIGVAPVGQPARSGPPAIVRRARRGRPVGHRRRMPGGAGVHVAVVIVRAPDTGLGWAGEQPSHPPVRARGRAHPAADRVVPATPQIRSTPPPAAPRTRRGGPRPRHGLGHALPGVVTDDRGRRVSTGTRVAAATGNALEPNRATGSVTVSARARRDERGAGHGVPWGGWRRAGRPVPG